MQRNPAESFFVPIRFAQTIDYMNPCRHSHGAPALESKMFEALGVQKKKKNSRHRKMYVFFGKTVERRKKVSFVAHQPDNHHQTIVAPGPLKYTRRKEFRVNLFISNDCPIKPFFKTLEKCLFVAFFNCVAQICPLPAAKGIGDGGGRRAD